MGMFEYVAVLTSIILGLGITHLLQGAAHLIQHPKEIIRLKGSPNYIPLGMTLMNKFSKHLKVFLGCSFSSSGIKIVEP